MSPGQWTSIGVSPQARDEPVEGAAYGTIVGCPRRRGDEPIRRLPLWPIMASRVPRRRGDEPVITIGDKSPVDSVPRRRGDEPLELS